MIIPGSRPEENTMSGIYENNCYFFEGERINWEQMFCLAQACMICRGGRWKKTHRLFVL
jgi:hypothetical protein